MCGGSILEGSFCADHHISDQLQQVHFDDFGDFGVSFASTVVGRYTRWGGSRLSVQGEPLIVLTRGP